MTKKSTNISGQKIIVNCDGELSHLADWLLEVLNNLFPQNHKFVDGEKVSLGWSIITLRKTNDNEFTVFEPDFEGDPFKDEVLNVSYSLHIQAEQNQFAVSAKADPIFVSFQDKIIVKKNCFKSNQLFMTRVEPNFKNHQSGWFIENRNESKTDDVSEDDFVGIYAFELIKLRPSILQTLALPPGYMVMEDNDRIQIIRPEHQ